MAKGASALRRYPKKKGENKQMKKAIFPSFSEKGIVSRMRGSSFSYQGWPTVCRDEDGTLYAAASSFRCAHVCPFGKNAMFISKNGGKTWTPPIVINDTYSDNRDAGLLYMGKGRILLTHFCHPATYYEKNKESLLTWAGSAEIKKGFAGVIDGLSLLPEEERLGGSYVRVSEDYGVTWTDNIRVPVTAPHGPCLCKDGSLIYLGKGTFSREEDGIDKHEIWAYASLDGGRSWEKRGICTPPAELPLDMLHEPHVLELPDGTLLGAVRSEVGSTGGGCFATFTTKSFDGGKNWTPWKNLGIIGSPPHLLLLSSGEILCSYGRREKPYGIRAIISADGGESWGEEYVIDEDFETYDLGYPSTVELDDGSLITVYYGHHGGPQPNDILFTKWRR